MPNRLFDIISKDESQVVDEFSGVLGLENEKRRPLFVDHNEISRFESSQSGNYRAVAETIREMATSILGLDYELSGSERCTL